MENRSTMHFLLNSPGSAKGKMEHTQKFKILFLSAGLLKGGAQIPLLRCQNIPGLS
jgi:hypothetical protein